MHAAHPYGSRPVTEPCCFLLPAEEPAEAEATPKKKKKAAAPAVRV
jgi:hypothetical protein